MGTDEEGCHFLLTGWGRHAASSSLYSQTQDKTFFISSIKKIIKERFCLEKLNMSFSSEGCM
jgi:hypothetical protein